jgi:Spy/CpxP family protein refolding chaperone
MKNRIGVVKVGVASAILAALALMVGLAAPAYAGIPKVGKTKNNGDNGPYGLPSLKRVTEVCSLTQPQEQAVLRVYNEYKHQEHEEMQTKTASGSTGRADCINAVKQQLTPEQQKKFDELLGESKGKKKKT